MVTDVPPSRSAQANSPPAGGRAPRLDCEPDDPRRHEHDLRLPARVGAGLPAGQAGRVRRHRGHGLAGGRDAAARGVARALPSLRAADPLRPRAGAAAHPLRVGTRPACEARAHRRARRRGRRRHRRGASPVPLASRATPSPSSPSCARSPPQHDVEIAVENMFPWRAAGRNLKAYSPGWDPRIMDCDAVTLDFSHAALSGVDSLQFANDLGERLRHVHLCDGSGAIGEGQVFDEHLLPGHGREPVAEVLQSLAARGLGGLDRRGDQHPQGQERARAAGTASRDARVRAHPHAPDAPPAGDDAIPPRARGDPPGPPALKGSVEGPESRGPEWNG